MIQRQCRPVSVHKGGKNHSVQWKCKKMWVPFQNCVAVRFPRQ